MTITTLIPVRVAGSVVSAGTTVTYAAEVEADLVHRKVASYVDDKAIPGAGGQGIRVSREGYASAVIGPDGTDALAIRSQWVKAAFYGDQSPGGTLRDASGNARHAQPTSRVVLAETWAAGRVFTTVEDTTSPYKAFYIPRALLDLDLAVHTIVFNLWYAKALPGATHYIGGNSSPGSSRGFLLQALTSGATRLTVRDNAGNQQNSNDAASTVDGVAHCVTFAVAREVSNVASTNGRYCWTYADGALVGGAPKHLQNVTEHTLAASDKDFFIGFTPSATASRAAAWHAFEILKFPYDSAAVNIAGIADAFYKYGKVLGNILDDRMLA